MDTAFRRPLRIAVVVTRNLAESNGRTPILSHIVRALGRRNETELFHLATIVESSDILGAVLVWLGSLLRGRPLPLQCVLYASPRQCRRIVKRIRDSSCDAVYLDTVRCQLVLRMLRRAMPDLHIVTDFDDLMSRRARYLFRHRLPFAVGHAGRNFPFWLRYLAEALLARPVALYEALTLPAAEKDVVALSDATVLLSSADRDMLAARARHAALHAIPPAVRAIRPPEARAPGRFVFIGSDSFIQNRTAIDFLLGAWRALSPPLPLHIYGRQTRAPAIVPGVYWHGFVEDLAQVYQPGSIALAPAQDRGGIKTKVLEAWAWGCPVLANPPAIEGLAIGHYALALPEAEWPAFLTQPHRHMDAWAKAARDGHDFVRAHLSARHFERAWEIAMCPDTFKSAAYLDPDEDPPAEFPQDLARIA